MGDLCPFCQPPLQHQFILCYLVCGYVLLVRLWQFRHCLLDIARPSSSYQRNQTHPFVSASLFATFFAGTSNDLHSNDLASDCSVAAQNG